METKIYNQTGEAVSTVELSESIFGLPGNLDLVHQVRVGLLANARRPVAHTKDRSEVRGGGRKPWRQKGTGRARHGSRRSPIWKGGGVSHGPRKEKNYSQKINSAMAKKALRTVLSSKFKSGEVRVIEDFGWDGISTKKFAAWANRAAGGDFRSLLIVLDRGDGNFYKSSRNLSNVEVKTVGNLNVLDALKFKKIVFTQSALKVLTNKQ